MAANGYTGNPPGSGGGGGPVAISDVTGLTAALAAKAPVASPTFTGTVAGVTAAMVGLGSVDNTADTAKPVSTAQQTALNLKANLASPTFTGTVAGITKTMVGLGNVDNTADAAKAFGQGQITNLTTDLAAKAALASPTFTGTPAAPTATPGTNTTQLASTAFVTAAVAAGGGGGSTLAVVRQTVTSGNLTMQTSGSWVAVTGSPTLAIAAAAGDYLEFQIVSLLGAFNVNFGDLAVMVGGSPVRYMATGTSSPATEGAPFFYGDQSFDRASALFEFEAEAGDISGGSVSVQFVTTGSGGGTIYASTDYPMRWRALNHGAVSVS